MFLPGGSRVQGICNMIGESDEVYRVTGGCELRMHLYLPDKACTPRSGVVFFFGGGWVEGTPNHFASQSRHLAGLGMVAACADYRVFSRHGTTPFDAVSDAKAAVRWMRQNSARLGFAPDRLVAAGGSAGGHLAACTAMFSGFEESGTSSVPNALMLFNPVLDTTERGGLWEKISAARWAEISPCHLICKGLPPTLLQHGDRDEMVPHEEAVRFARDMSAAGNDCRLVTYPGRKHGFFNRKERNADAEESDYVLTLAASVAFLREIGFLQGDRHPNGRPNQPQ